MSADHGDDVHGASRMLLDKLRALERENEGVRDELQHVRRRLSNNQQEREEERVRAVMAHGALCWSILLGESLSDPCLPVLVSVVTDSCRCRKV